jgi:hypothetical protein
MRARWMVHMVPPGSSAPPPRFSDLRASCSHARHPRTLRVRGPSLHAPLDPRLRSKRGSGSEDQSMTPLRSRGRASETTRVLGSFQGSEATATIRAIIQRLGSFCDLRSDWLTTGRHHSDQGGVFRTQRGEPQRQRCRLRRAVHRRRCLACNGGDPGACWRATRHWRARRYSGFGHGQCHAAGRSCG